MPRCTSNWLIFALAGLILASAAGAGEPRPPASFTYEIDEPGRVSAAVYDADGRLLRELIRGERQQAGQHTLHWDGLDRHGNPQPTGEYEWRVLRTPGFRAEYVTSLGINPDSAPYHRWVGNHGGPASVAVDESGVYLAATVTETAPVLLKQSLDGEKRLWTRGRGDVTKGRFQGGVSLATDGDGTLYMLQQNAYIQVIDAEAGRVRATWDLLPEDDRRRKDGRLTHRRYKHGGAVSMIDLAARGETVVMSYHDRDMLRWLSPEDGSVAAEVNVEDPWGVAIGPDQKVYVVSGSRIITVSPAGERSVVVAEKLNTPRRIAIEPKSGDLLVAEIDPTHQVKRFSSDGQLRATWGRKGGRRDGLYVPTDFLNITDICADDEGGFLITEERSAPRRVARFDREGELVEEWYGGQPYYAWGEPDPRNPLRVWFNPGGWLTLAEIDPEEHTWRVLENYRQGALGAGLVGTVTGHRGRWRVLYRGDQRYLVSEGVPQVLAHEEGSLRPVTVLSADGARVKRAAEIAGHEGGARSFRWIDTSGDGTPQPAELTFSGSRNVPRGRSVAENFEVVGMASGSGDGEGFVRVTRTRPRWTEHGPVYPVGDEEGINETVGQVTVDSPATTGGTRGAAALRDRAGNYYAAYNTRHDSHGSSWPTLWGARSRVAKWDAEGNLRWQVGRHAIHGGLGGRPHTTPPGYMHVPAALIGEVHGSVVLADRVEWMGMVWAQDGLYVGNVLDGRVEDGLPDTVYYWWRTPEGKEAIITSDNASGGAIVEAEDGTVYFFTQGRNSVPVYRIHGWEGWRRLSGRVALEDVPPHAKAEGTGLTARYYRPGRKKAAGELEELFGPQGDDFEEPEAVRVDRRIWHGIPRHNPGNHGVIDGFKRGPIYDWSDGVKPLEEAESAPTAGEALAQPTRSFAVRWTGEFEAPLSETFIFSVYHRGKVRLWIDGRQRIFGWNPARQRRETDPIRLEAGRRYSTQLDFRSDGLYPACSLNWESPGIDRRRIPPTYLYPARIQVAEKPDPRPATARIHAAEFDRTNIETNDHRSYTRGLRQRGLGVSGSHLGFERIDFGDGVSMLKTMARGTPAGKGQFEVTLEFRLDKPDGPAIATIAMRDGKTRLRTAELIRNVSGHHDVYVVNTTPKRWHFVGLSWFTFE